MKIRNTSSPTGFSVKHSGSLVAALLLLGVVMACRSSSSDSSSETICTGEVTYEGKTFTGKGKNAEEGQKSACINYCLNADPEVEVEYGNWYESHYGKWHESPKGPSKKEAIDNNKELFDYAYKTCANKCVASVKEGKLKGETKCP